MRIGTRGSALALAQAHAVAAMLGGAEVVTIRTSGDRESGGAADKSRWVDAIEDALRAGEIDLAVHSAKDLPSETAAELALLGAPPRAPAEDVLCGIESLDALRQGASVGAGSLRRMAQLRAVRPDLQLEPIRGNVDTRLARLKAGRTSAGAVLEAIVLAEAGLSRLGLSVKRGVLDPARFVPSPGQGALALEGRVEDGPVAAAVASVTDAATFACVLAERALTRALGAGCDTPLGALASANDDGSLGMSAWIGLPDGSAWIADACSGDRNEPGELGQEVAQRMLAMGAAAMLASAAAMAK